MATVPSVPTITSATATALANGVTQFSIAYTPPTSDGGSPITSYYVKRSPEDATPSVSTSSPYVFSPININPGAPFNANYRFSIAAVNGIGVGPYTSNAAIYATTDKYTVTMQSATVIRVAFNPATMPAPPVSVSAVNPGDARNPNTWYLFGEGTDLPATSVTEIDSYTFDIQFSSSEILDSSYLTTPFPGFGNSLQLTDGSTFQVIAVYRDLNPSAPTLTSITPSNSSLTLDFTAAIGYPDYPVTFYEYSLDGGTTFYTAAVTGSSFTISGLVNGTSYTVTARALTTLGTYAQNDVFVAVGPWSNALTATPSQYPSAPTIDTVTSSTGKLTVAYTASVFDGGSPIIRYEYSLNGGGTYTSVAFTNPFEITGLTNGTSYTVILRAVNAVGNGPWSVGVSGTPGAAPSAPTITSVEAVTSTSLLVTFTPPVNDGGLPVTLYWYTLDGMSPVSIGTSPSFLLPGLVTNQTYEVKLAAANAVGISEYSLPAFGTPTFQYKISAVGDRIARVALDVASGNPPIHVSSTGANDALNPRSWSVTELSNPLRNLSVMSVQQADTAGYVYDILTLEAFSRSNGSPMRLTGNLVLEDSSALIIDEQFAGSIQKANSTDLAQATKRGVYQRDLANVIIPQSDFVGGTLVINSAGDYESMSGEALVKKLVMRRLISKRGDFFHLPDYGAGLGVKETFSRNNLPMLAKEIEMQVMLEPEVEAAKASVSYSVAASALVIQVQAKMRSTGRVTALSMNLPLGSVQF